MSTDIQTFTFSPDVHLRSIIKDGEPWFIVSDVCKALSIQNPSQVVSTLDDDEKGLMISDTAGGAQKLLVVNESGMYSLILRSRKPVAKPFRKWVTATLLPSLRKDGLYILGQERSLDNMPLPDLIRFLSEIQAKVDSHATLRIGEWSAARCQEERDARRMGFRLLKSRR